jgi:hypothetical protein
LQVGFHAVGDLVQDVGALGRRGLAPGFLGGMGGVQRQLDVFALERATSQKGWPVIGVMFGKYSPLTGATKRRRCSCRSAGGTDWRRPVC